MNAQQDAAVITGYLNEYRQLTSDLVVLAMAEAGSGWEVIRERVGELVAPRARDSAQAPSCRPIAAVASRSSRPRPLTRRTASQGISRTSHGADVVHVSGSLADRRALRHELEGVDADLFVVELKAAAVDVVAEARRNRGVEVVVAGSDVLPAAGEELALDDELMRLAAGAAG